MNSSGYIANPNKPTAPTGTVLICALVLSGTFNKASDVPVLQANGDYFYGEPDKTYNRLTVRYVYAQALEIS